MASEADFFDANFDLNFKRISEDVVGKKRDPNLFEEQFMEMKSNQERVAFILRDVHAMDRIHKFIGDLLGPDHGDGGPTKCPQRASRIRAEGNNLFKNKHFPNAVHRYNEAIIWAPHDPNLDELSLCYANRSAAYFHLDLFEYAILDVNEALRLNYPKERTPMLFIRKLKSLRSLGKDREAKAVVEEAKVYVENNVKEASLKEELLKQINSLPDLQPLEESPSFDLTLKDPNERLFGANNSVRMGYDPEKGRTIEATKDIEEGEVIIMEKSFVSWLEPSCYSDYCYHCLKLMKGRIVPCPRCPLVRFCSAHCSNESWTQYHSIECPYFETLATLPVGHMALKLVLISGINEALRVEKEPSISFAEWPNLEFKADFRAVSSLTELSECYGFDKLFYYSLAAVAFALFAEKLLLVTESDRLDYAVLMSKLFFQIKHNIFYVNDQEIKPSIFKGLYYRKTEVEPKSIAVCLNLTAALFNHSCSPNAKHLYIDSKIVFIASRVIGQGEEVCISYKPRAKNTVLRERKEWLKRNFPFDCQCAACLADEPCLPYFKCPACGGNLIPNEYDISINDCIDCKRRDQDMTALMRNKAKLEKYLDEGITCHNNDQLEEAETMLLKAEKLSLKVFQKTCPLLIKIKVALSIVYKFIEDYDLAITYRLVALELEKTFSGENSCQVLEHMVHLNYLYNSKNGTVRDKETIKEGVKYYEMTKQLFRKIESMELKLISEKSIEVYQMAYEAFA